MSMTTDNPDDPGLREIGPDGMQSTYLVLSEAERAMGFVRPLRRTYIHVGPGGHEVDPHNPARHGRTGAGCGVATTMGQAIAETYARNPGFYGGTFCVGCGAHFPVGKDGEFVWADAPAERVGT